MLLHKHMMNSNKNIFGSNYIPEIVQLFKENDPDGSKGLDIEQFCVVMTALHGDSISVEELKEIYYKIDTSYHDTVTLDELLAYLHNRYYASDIIANKNKIFPKPFKNIDGNAHREIIQLTFCPKNDDLDQKAKSSTEQLRSYQKGQYISISANGKLTSWTDNFDRHLTTELSLEENKYTLGCKKICVTDMLYLEQVNQLAVSTLGDELLFYKYTENVIHLAVNHAMLVKDTVNAMNYWFKDSKAVFSFGDICGNLSVFISYWVKTNGLFCKEAYEKISLMKYPTVYQVNLLRNTHEDFLCFKVPIFQDVCSQILYFPSLDSIAMCSKSSQTMALTALPKGHRSKATKHKATKKVYHSRQKFFNCVDYSPIVESLATGGEDGILRIWTPHTTICQNKVIGHSTAITHIKFNHYNRTIISISKDMNMRLWSQNAWLCLQSMHVQGMGSDPISSVYYSPHNNALILANSNIATCLGQGTDGFANTLTSHDNPICNVLHHDFFKQVITACQTGVVILWDILTGQPLLEFKVTPDQVGLTAMSFDEPQRRLITVSQNGTLKLWNFNSGAEIAVCPMILPDGMTNVVCLNNRIFVSGKDSKTIFNLDMKEFDIQFMEHSDLNDISTMDGYEKTLVTVSSYGNIVMWEVSQTAQALYLLNPTTNPQCQTEIVSLERSQETNSDSSTKSTQSLLLRTRNDPVNAATLLISADDYICAWSVIASVGPLGKFRAVEQEDAVVTTMSTDANEEILLIGDSIGNIYLWDITEFGIKRPKDKGPFEDINGWRVSLRIPPLLNSWRAHRTKVVSVKCDPACKNVFTAGLDCKVRLWKNTGWHLGLLGKDSWDPQQFNTLQKGGNEAAKSPVDADETTSPILVPEFPLPDFDHIRWKVQMTMIACKSRDIFLRRCKNELQYTLKKVKKDEKKEKKSIKTTEDESRQEITRSDSGDLDSAICKFGFLEETLDQKHTALYQQTCTPPANPLQRDRH